MNLRLLIFFCHFVFNAKSSLIRTTRQVKNEPWPDGIVPFDVWDDFKRITKCDIPPALFEAMEEIHEHSCVRFKPRTNDDKYYVTIKGHETLCRSPYGFPGDVKPNPVILVTSECISSKEQMLKQLMAILGFLPEHQRPDRDEYINIFWNNIPEKYRELFKIRKGMRMINVTYDFDSVLHQSVNFRGKKVLVPKGDTARIPRRKNKLSELDREKIRKYYDCGMKIKKDPEAMRLEKPEKWPKLSAVIEKCSLIFAGDR